MNTKFIIAIVAVFIGIILLSVAWYVFFVPKVAPQPTPGTTTTLPSSGSINPATGEPFSGVTPTFPLTTQTGETVSALDFIHNGVTIEDGANPGRYLLAGNLGYCLSNPIKCQAAPATNFSVYYNSGPKSFTIDLSEEPIGKARLAMEQFMLKTLGVTQAQLCSLNYLVGVSIEVNSQFAGKNLGFSFCPGATVLPL